MTARLKVVRFEPVYDAQHIHTLVTGPEIVCAFDNGCSDRMRDFGGFDEHHAWPLSAGGPANQPKLILCPNHHRRQHAMFRYLVECDEAGVRPDYWGILIHATPAERDTVKMSLTDWIGAGRPAINGWPCLAATAA